MGYELGVDLGTTYTAAAKHRDGTAQIVELGTRAASIPSVIFLTDTEEILTGESANRRAVTEPGRVAREFKRRIGDPTPILLGGSPYSAESLSARLLEWVIAKVTEREGEAPSRVAVTHPANWGPFKLDLLHQAFRLANLDQVVTLTEPEAAAIHYSTLERVDPGTVVGVFDLGGGTFDAAILRKKTQGFDFLGDAEGIERLGGIDFDAAVFGFVQQSLGEVFEQLDANDPTALAAVSRLRRECVEAKEALSSDTEVTIPVVLPGVHTDLRLTRVELERMVRPSLTDTIGAMERAIRGASLQVDEVDVILLVGGSSRIPLVGQMVSSELGRPVAVDAHPKHSVALGAAWAAAPTGVAHLASATVVASTDGLGVATPDPVTAQPPAGATVQAANPGPVTSQPLASPDPAPGAPDPVTAQPAAFIPAAGAGSTDPSSPSSPPSQPAGAPAAGLAAAGAGAVGGVSAAGGHDAVTGGAGGGGPSPESAPLGSVGSPSGSGSGGSSRTGLLVGIGVAAVVLLIAGGVALSQLAGGGDGDDEQAGQGLAESQAGDAETGRGETAETTMPDDTTETTETTSTTEAPTTQTTPTTEPPFECAGLCTHVPEEGVVVQDNGELLIYWEPFNFTGDPDIGNFHAHFFYDIYEPEQVGSNAAALGVEQGNWQLTDNIPFDTTGTNVSVANAPAGATQICVVAADSGHGVINPENAECFPLP